MKDRIPALFTSKIRHLEIKQKDNLQMLCFLSQSNSNFSLPPMLSFQKQVIHCLLHLDIAGQLFHFSGFFSPKVACVAQPMHCPCDIDKTQC